MHNPVALKYLLAIALIVALLVILVFVIQDNTADYAIGNALPDAEERYKNADSGYQTEDADTDTAIPAPSFNYNSGYYSGTLNLEISADSRCRIYYTLDASIPDNHSLLYTEPISIQTSSGNEAAALSDVDSATEDTVIVRAVAYGLFGMHSDVVTNVYFFDDETSSCHIPTIAIVTDPRNLYDETIGIFTNYMMYGWEREAQFSYFGIDGLIFQQNIGIRVRGSSTRDGEQKSLTLYAREQYSNSKTFEHSFFDTDTNAFILRIRPIAQKEGFISSLVADRDVAVQEYQMANLYINQEYFGIYAFMNRVDTDFLGNKYNVDSDDIEYIKIGHIFALPEENMEGYQQFLAYEDYWTNTDMSIEDNYLQACEYVDMQSLIDYYAIQIYINNVDFSYKKNTLLWKTKNVADGEYSDGRWRYGLFDLDFSIYFALDDTEWTYDFDFFTGDQPYVSPLYEDPVFMSLMKSQEFRQRFYDSFVEIAETNFNPERVRALLDAQPYQVNNDIIAEFFDQRPLYIFDDLDAFMENYEAYYTTSEEPIAKPAVEPKDESIIDTIKESETLLVGLPVFLLMLVWLIIAYWRKYGDSSRSKKGNE